MKKFLVWLRQPSSVVGIGDIVMVATGAIVGVLTHRLDLTAAAGLVAGGLAKVLIPDNSVAQVSSARLGEDLAKAAIERRIGSIGPLIAQDALALLNAFSASSPPPPVAASVPSLGPVNPPAPAPAPAPIPVSVVSSAQPAHSG